MFATGIIRRFDDIGRINIPKEIRRKMFGSDCTEGKPLEIYIENNNVVLKPYI